MLAHEIQSNEIKIIESDFLLSSNNLFLYDVFGLLGSLIAATDKNFIIVELVISHLAIRHGVVIKVHDWAELTTTGFETTLVYRGDHHG
jgi:hypothetical protein